MSDTLPLIGAVEAGGTKFMVAVGTGPDDLRDVTRIPTTTPAETLAKVTAYFQEAAAKHGAPAAFGVGTFGPAGVHPGRKDFGYITTTPKAGWAHTDLLAALRAAADVPMAFDTDVNAAACGEWKHGAGRECGAVLYLTVGTGIGGGFVIDGRPLHGLIHPEMGHIRTPRAGGDNFAGACPWHGACLEGMASGPAIAARWGKPAGELPPDHPAWEMEAEYLALACVNFLTCLSPEKVILGGGVMDQPQLLPMIRRRTAALLNGYLSHPGIASGLEDIIVAPGLGSRSGLAGALALGAAALE